MKYEKSVKVYILKKLKTVSCFSYLILISCNVLDVIHFSEKTFAHRTGIWKKDLWKKSLVQDRKRFAFQIQNDILQFSPWLLFSHGTRAVSLILVKFLLSMCQFQLSFMIQGQARCSFDFPPDCTGWFGLNLWFVLYDGITDIN